LISWKKMSRRINPGDLVRRKYHISRPDWKWVDLGLVMSRDSNGYLDILWGSKLESMWDDYDLMRVEEPMTA